MIKIIVTGSKGRMGQSILNCARQDPKIEVVAMLDRGEDLRQHAQAGTVIIDFTSHMATPGFAQIAEQAGCPMVIGTNGFTYVEKKVIINASKAVPIVMAPNMSVGVNLLFSLAQVVTSVLKKDYDIEIIEKHHKKKKDSPSGTATHLAEIIAETRGVALDKAARHGRFGDIGERTADEIGIHSIRGGDFVGDHTVIFSGDGDVIEITHRANSRDIFARGALVAAQWVRDAAPGLYDMGHVLGLEISRQST